MKYPKHLDYIYIKPWKGCSFGLARVYKRVSERMGDWLDAEGHCLDEFGKPMSFTLCINRKEGWLQTYAPLKKFEWKLA